MNYMVNPQDNLSPTQLFDEWCVKDRVKQLKQLIIQILVDQDLKEWALEHKKRFEEVPPYPLDQEGIEKKFCRQAEQEAWKIIEEERRLLAKRMQDYVKAVCNLAISQLNNIVWTRGKDGKAEKHKIRIERIPNPNKKYKDEPDFMDIRYIGDHDFQTLERIDRIESSLNEFRFIIDYCDAETQELFGKAMNLATLERVEKK